MDYETLKQRHRSVRDGYPDNLNLRIHRALSWWQRALVADDVDGRFIFLWIAFNATYATEIDENYRLSEQATFRAYLEKLCAMDQDKHIDSLVWQEFSGSIRVLLDTPYVFQSFWDWQSGKITQDEWQKRFDLGKKQANCALASGNTASLLGVIFNRLYTLRNQLRDCTNLLGKLVPILISLMLENPNTLWGEACYPVVRES